VDLKAAYLVTGTDWPKLDAALTRLRRRFAEDAVEQLSGAEADGGAIVAACNAIGLLAEQRLVLVRQAEELDEASAEVVAAYCRDPAPDVCLALFAATSLPDGHPLAAAMAAGGEVLRYDAPDRKAAASWVARRFTDQGVRCGMPAARRLVELAGEDVGDLALEVDKVAAYCAGGEVEVEDVELLVSASLDVKPWDITDAWGRRDAASAVALATADMERPDDVHRLLGSLLSHVRKVRRALVLSEAGASQADVAKDLRVKPFPARKLIEQSRRFSEEELAGAIVLLGALDVAVKGGSRLDPRFELELALADISRG
jgi:DNA polymerase III subunit delta